MDATETASPPNGNRSTPERELTRPALVAVSVWFVVAIVLVLAERLVA